jgi:exopolyphosphatase/guanosine-5'-triphosphate,3'-diphosphate pyrophosphatase
MVGVDLGSNSLRAVRIDCESLEIIDAKEWIVRTAEELEATGKIGEAALERILEALCELKKRWSDEEFHVVATAAFRRAKNAKEVVAKIEERCGFEVEIIDPELESYYSAKGAEFGLRRLGQRADKFLLVDIGGGSTEIILKHRGELVAQSFPVGILTTIQKYRTKEEILFGIKKRMQSIRSFCQDIFELFGKPKLFLGTGGTPATVAALKVGLDYETYDPKKVDGVFIDLEDVKSAYKRLIVLPKEQRAKLVGTGREDAIIAGLVILEELMKKCEYSKMMVMDESVREGVALEFCEKKDKIA